MKETAGGNQVLQKLIFDGEYLKPGKSTRVLAILESLSRDSGLSQFELGSRLNLSGAMVNQYLKQLQAQELVEFMPVNGKSYRYVLTPEGEQRRREMLSDYSSETVRLYTSVKEYVLNRLRPLVDKKITRLALFGAGETCEVVLSAIKDLDFKVMAILDNEQAKQGMVFHGHVISAPHVLEQVGCEAVIITSFGKQDEIFDQIRPVAERRGLQIVRF